MYTEQSEYTGFSLDKLPVYGRVLLLQGPVGPFFRRLGRLLERRGSRVTKVNFNAGDDWYYPAGNHPGVIRFSGRISQWPAFLQALLADGDYDAIFLFGDCRPIHRPVGEIAAAAACAVLVFEEGYFRPSYITLERSGVNAFSSLMKLDLEQLRAEPLPAVPEATEFPDAFRQMASQAFIYFAAMAFGSWRYRHYLHHRAGGFFEALRWIRSWIRRGAYSVAEANTIRQVLAPQRRQRFFVFPLQVHNDAQICSHSDSNGIHLSLREVVRSFAQHASREDWLVIKHHPMDRGHTNYSRTIAKLVAEFALAGRVYYLHDVRLPTLFDHSKGLVTVNSTAGLQGMDHKLPVITLGRSFYNRPGLTFQGGLDAFWTTDWKPDHELYRQFRAWTILTTQINSSFYGDPTCGSKRYDSLDAPVPARPAEPRFLGPAALDGGGDSIGPAVTAQS